MARGLEYGLMLTLLLGLAFCSNAQDNFDNIDKSSNLDSADGVRIAWDYSSMQQLAPKGGYPRLLRLQDNSLVVVYETYTGNTELIRSYDNGTTWTNPLTTFSQFTYTNDKDESTLVNISNPEVYQLANGDILLACNYRPQKAEIAPYSIAIKRSTDNGLSWHDTQVLYNAAPRFGDGCWEPSFLQLPNGEVQVYFANENPYRQSDEQEISMLSSQDNGITWTTDTKKVSFRKHRRDGMPVARIIGDEIVVVIEDNNIDRFKPYTVRNKITDNWSAPVLADSPQREYALANNVDDSVYMGAPYLLKLPSGETVISYQTTEHRSSDWELSTMEVAIGDKEARRFNRLTRPFDVSLDKEAKWNSLAMWDENTIVALASSNFSSENVSPWMIKGHIIPELVIKNGAIDSYPIFIGAKGMTNLRCGIGSDEQNIHLKCIVKDDVLYADDFLQEKADGVYFYTYSQNNSFVSSEKEIYKLGCNYKGDMTLWKSEGERWKTLEVSDIQIYTTKSTDGYSIELTVPRKLLLPLGQKSMRLCMVLSAYTDANNNYTEVLTNCDTRSSDTWIEVKF